MGEENDAISAITSAYGKAQDLLDICRGWFLESPGGEVTFRTVWQQTDSAIKEEHQYLIKDFKRDGKCMPACPTSKIGLIERLGGDERLCYAHFYNYDDNKKSCLELWDSYGMKKRYDLSGKDIHGQVYTNSEFSSLSSSHDGELMVYVAEKKSPKAVSFYTDNAKSTDNKGGVFDYTECWGEQLDKCKESVLCVLNMRSGDVQVLDTPEDVFCATPVFCGNDTIYYVGFDLKCVKHGAIYCKMRPSRLYSYHLTTSSTTVHTTESKSIHQPSPHHESGKVAFMFCDHGGPHRQYMEIGILDNNNNNVTTVQNSLFCGSLSPSPWLNENELVVASYEGVTSDLYRVDLQGGTKCKLLPAEYKTSDRCVSVLDQKGTKLLIQVSGLNPVIEDRTRQRVCYVDVDISTNVLELGGDNSTDNCSGVQCQYTIESFSREGREYNGILIKPGPGSPDHRALIVYPHGGPHSMFTTSFRTDTWVLAQLGYSNLLVNYTGSLGLGPDSLNQLPGRVGDVDVKDAQHAAREIVAREGFTRVAVWGGSHGGFLTAHLIGQYPEFYKAAVMRNPVVDISAMVGVSDIPDWCYVEAGIPYNPYQPPLPSPDHLKKMLEVSPIIYLNQVTCPVLMMIGEKDLRVPPSQGLRYVRYLKSRGVECLLKVYPEDCHPLSTVACAADAIVHIHLWFKKHLAI